ncbi:hypothetical protein HMPREF0766_12349 [Sphingobacterium spiritivorum ATCC 33861]|uniref:Uncharacterized protein n=1 Tax=Sphingobacterium spiritivorum ATCC 33861 TaxID=525373 RepID=D7VMX9_SPHSI|nr:hypothetical protein HMPREF0766_12349 [Sphingobacterium spiritivorum ATCC 33861]
MGLAFYYKQEDNIKNGAICYQIFLLIFLNTSASCSSAINF